MIFTISKHSTNTTHWLVIQPSEQLLCRFGIVHIGGGDHYSKQQAHTVYNDMAFSTVNILGIVSTALFASRRRIDRLAIDAGRCAGMVRFLHGSHPGAEFIVNGVESSIVSPFVEVTPHSASWRKVAGQHTPLATGPQKVQDRIHNISKVRLTWPPARMIRQIRLDQSPLSVRNVAGIA
jgi:hypothetical protein